MQSIVAENRALSARPFESFPSPKSAARRSGVSNFFHDLIAEIHNLCIYLRNPVLASDYGEH